MTDESSDLSLDRRGVLAGLSTVAAAGLAGCSSNKAAKNSSSKTSRGIPDPTVPKRVLSTNGWKLMSEDTIEDTYSIGKFGFETEFDIRGRTEAYQDADLRKRIKEDTLGYLDNPIVVFSATKLGLYPNILEMTGGVGVKEVLDLVEKDIQKRFQSNLGQYGLTDVQKVSDGTIQVNTGEDARYQEYTAKYPYDSMEIPITDEKTVKLDGGEVEFNGLLALWIHDGNILLAGGVYPGENFTKSKTVDVTDAITTSISVDLGFTPSQYKKSLKTAAKSTR